MPYIWKKFINWCNFLLYKKWLISKETILINNYLYGCLLRPCWIVQKNITYLIECKIISSNFWVSDNMECQIIVIFTIKWIFFCHNQGAAWCVNAYVLGDLLIPKLKKKLKLWRSFTFLKNPRILSPISFSIFSIFSVKMHIFTYSTKLKEIS